MHNRRDILGIDLIAEVRGAIASSRLAFRIYETSYDDKSEYPKPRR
jgi:hypothetical protein